MRKIPAIVVVRVTWWKYLDPSLRSLPELAPAAGIAKDLALDFTACSVW
jgi:hypothetical protein